MINAISHLTFIVEDLDKASIFFKKIFDAKEVYSSENKNFSLSSERFFLINDIWIAIMEGKKMERSYNHIAFKIEDNDYDMYLDRINKLGLEIKDPRPRIEGEGNSIYFYDFDNHLFELHTGSLSDRLASYKKHL